MMQERNAQRRAAELLERPLSPRSLIGSLLLGMRPPRMPAGRLVQWCALFGVAEGTARVALSRMVDRGELAAADGVYELAGPAAAAASPRRTGASRPSSARGTASGCSASSAPGARSPTERAALRDAGAPAAHGRAARGRVDPARQPAARRGARRRVEGRRRAVRVVDGRGPTPTRVALAARAVRRRRRGRTRARMLQRPPRARRRPRSTPATATALADAFVVGAAALAHVRADPLLPAELCGRDWPGDALRARVPRVPDPRSRSARPRLVPEPVT